MIKFISSVIFVKDNEVEELDDIYTTLLKNQVELVHGILEQPWGQRVFRVYDYDPDKHIVELGEPMNVVIRRFYESGMTLEEVAERCSTPLSIVSSVIEGRGTN